MEQNRESPINFLRRTKAIEERWIVFSVSGAGVIGQSQVYK
jgi:hypothetical protein